MVNSEQLKLWEVKLQQRWEVGRPLHNTGLLLKLDASLGHQCGSRDVGFIFVSCLSRCGR